MVEIDEIVVESIGDISFVGFVISLFFFSIDEQLFVSVIMMDNEDDDLFGYLRIVYVQLVNIKVEFLDDNEDVEQVYVICVQYICVFFYLGVYIGNDELLR